MLIALANLAVVGCLVFVAVEGIHLLYDRFVRIPADTRYVEQTMNGVLNRLAEQRREELDWENATPEQRAELEAEADAELSQYFAEMDKGFYTDIFGRHVIYTPNSLDGTPIEIYYPQKDGTYRDVNGKEQPEAWK